MSVIAVVDVGSNSIKVAVIAATDRRELGRKSEAVRLQPEGGPAEPFSAEARAEAVAAIGRLIAFARCLGATRLCLLATSAVRESVSRQDFAREVESATGVPLTIVSGEVEARLAAAGVRADPAYEAYDDILSFDLGGGSLEVSVLRGQRCVLARSFPLGSVRLTHGFLRGGNGPVDELDQLSIRTHLLASLQTVVPAGAAEKFLIVGAGGVFAAVALHLEALGETPVGGRLPLLRIRELRDRMCATDLAGRRAIPGIPAERADIMPAALITLCVLADLTGAEAFHLSHYGVRQGMVELLLGPSGEHL
jgi:exopolyphosphatase / guanosine-5'-triphosphate,3'-diphosphate pyrophosphatase